MKKALAPFYWLLELQIGYKIIQCIGRPTVKLFRRLISENVPYAQSEVYLDIGCGIGGYRNQFPQNYYGIDINSKYIEYAKINLKGEFRIMDCTQLDFKNDMFDHVVTIAKTHHLNDEQLLALVSESLRVLKKGGEFHLIDAILPESKLHFFKYLWFKMDRGEYPRRMSELINLLNSQGIINHHKKMNGLLHDVLYVNF